MGLGWIERLVAPAQAAANDFVETSFSFLIVDFVRRHPMATFLIALGAILALALVALYVVRRVKREAREYVASGQRGWRRLRERAAGRIPRREDTPRNPPSRLSR